MQSWIFIVTDHKDASLTAEQIFAQRMRDCFWGLGDKTPNRRSLEEGDRIVFYVGGSSADVKSFAGSAVVASDAKEQLTEAERETFSHGQDFYRALFGVRLKQVEVWQDRRPVAPLVPHLDFIENKKYWGTYFQGGVRAVPQVDFNKIINGQSGNATTASQPNVATSAESNSEFALEAHLEDFIDRNWDGIDFGRKLIRYQADEQDGRQFPAGAWSIDFLCTDKGSGAFVVIELKRGKSSDAVVGQILRYMSWVRENLAKGSQKIEGIIIASEVDDALRYAVRSVPDIAVLTYRVDFKLQHA